MALYSFSVHHLDHGMAAVTLVAPATEALAARLLRRTPIEGVFVLSTCNRLEIYVDSSAPMGSTEAVVRAEIRAALAEQGQPVLPHAIPIRTRASHATMQHLFRVAAGLDSMVVGEREIAGQLRRATKAARAAGAVTPTLNAVAEHALRCSRRIASSTTLSDHGRSVVSVGLTLARESLSGCPRDARVLLAGTGAYAGSVVHTLRAQGFRHITVHSRSGRAASFAASHGVTATDSLHATLADADIVVCCSGKGGHVLDVPDVAAALRHPRFGDLVLLDLALRRDVADEVRELPGVALWTLSDIHEKVGALTDHQVHAAEELISSGIDNLIATLRGRQMDPAVVALRDLVSTLVTDEIERLPREAIEPDEAAHALRRLAARLIHEPMVRARAAAQQGRRDEYLSALEQVWDIDVTLPEASVSDDDTLDPGTLECGRCPATGFELHDLAPKRRHLEAL